MKKALILIAVVAVAFGGSAASASDFAVFGSYLDTEDLDTSVGGGIRAGFGNRFQLDLRASYFPDLTEDLEELLEEDPRRHNDIEAIPLDAGLKINFGADQAAFNPYLGGGLTYYLMDAERGEVDDEAGFYVAGGLDFARQAGGMGFFAEVIYREIEATVERDPEDFDDIDDIDFETFRRADLDIGGIGVNAGLIWKF